jgi:hypothetical protein
LDALASEPPCPDPFSPALRKTHPLANTLKRVRDIKVEVKRRVPPSRTQNGH